MWREVIRKNKKVDILINNAARTLGKRIKDLSFESFKKTLEINFLSIV
jgi:short-subunit dehydrogenase